ncbi:kinase-like domain-containing protein [Russula aff. rugulosa BPL654]|nr:kinase-like domain-containing protein [Russula aff. rugulosa BPL654]
MRHAIQSNGTAVVVKLLHPDTNELQFLRHFHQINSPDNHTIPLLATFKLNIGTFICFRNNVVDFSRQLIEGVGFLHRHGIAHLDIKPENIVALPHQLFIIDFDISVRVSGPNALIDRWCGTPGWMAPEIGRRNGPRCSYSPIRADLWSCGRVLQYLAREGAVKEENPFEALTWQLLNKVPQNRPLLLRHHPSQLTVGHSMSQLQHRLKRKADDLPHSSKRLAICTAQP